MRPVPLLAFVFASSLPLTAASSSDPSPEPPSVLFNHFFVVTDAATYAEAQASRFLTKESHLSRSGRPSATTRPTPGSTSTAGARTSSCSSREPRGRRVRAGSPSEWRLRTGAPRSRPSGRKRRGGAEGGPVTRKTDTEEVPWFEMTFAKGGRPRPRRPRSCASGSWSTTATSSPAGIRTSPPLAPSPAPTCSTVTCARIGQACAPRQLPHEGRPVPHPRPPRRGQGRALHTARAIGYTVREDKGATVLVGPDVRLRVVPAPEGAARGVLEAEFSLQSRVTRAQHRLGSAVLTVEADRARLRFGIEAK